MIQDHSPKSPSPQLCYKDICLKVECKCQKVIDLEPFHIFKIKRKQSTQKKQIYVPIQNYFSICEPEDAVAADPSKNLLISVPKITRMYLAIAEKRWRSEKDMHFIVESVKRIPVQEQEVLFSLLTKLRFGVTKSVFTKTYSDAAFLDLVKSDQVYSKGKQDFRKMIIGAFYSQKLQSLGGDCIGNLESRSLLKKRNFISHYFKDYIAMKGPGSMDLMLYYIFNCVGSNRASKVNMKKRGVGNICYMSDILPKSDFLTSELLHFTKVTFMKDILEDYDEEIERYIFNLVTDYNQCTEIDNRAQSLSDLVRKIQRSSKFKFPWDKSIYQQAVIHLTKVIEDKLYLKKGRGEYKTMGNK